MWGDAVDLSNLVHPSGDRLSCNAQYTDQNPLISPATATPCYTEYERMATAARRAVASYVETPDLPCAYNCVHADWRNTPGDFQHGPADQQ
jgi:hypothetical protein